MPLISDMHYVTGQAAVSIDPRAIPSGFYYDDAYFAVLESCAGLVERFAGFDRVDRTLVYTEEDFRFYSRLDKHVNDIVELNNDCQTVKGRSEKDQLS